MDSSPEKKQRVLTGVRPTGPLHLGHYVGALSQWLDFQKVGQYEMFLLIADLQAFTDHSDDPGRIQNSVLEVALDWLAVGLDPNVCHFVLQSKTKVCELSQIFGSLTPRSWIDRNPTLKSEEAQLKEVTVSFLDYPVHQAADIALPLATMVPVGEDQLPHIELTREIVRRFNSRYGNLFPEPRGLVGKFGRLVGTDGKDKMSKSLGNVIQLKDGPEAVEIAVKRMYTDPTRLHATDPGHIEGNPVFVYHQAFNPAKNEVTELENLYQAGKVSDLEVKNKLIVVLNNFLAPIIEKRHYFEQRKDEVVDFIKTGTQKHLEISEPVMSEVYERLGMKYF